MFEHTDEQVEKRELMHVLARAPIKIDRGDIDNAADERIGEARDGIIKILEMLKVSTSQYSDSETHCDGAYSRLWIAF
jgi:hypothetical protein